MKEVSVRAIPVLIQAAEQRGADLDALFEGLSFGRRDIQKLWGRVDWDEFSILLDRIADIAGSSEELTRIGRAFVDSKAVSGSRAILAIAISVRQLYQILNRWVGPTLFHAVESYYEATEDVVEVGLQLKPGYRSSRPFFDISRGGLSALPRVLGQSAVRVDADISPRWAKYVVHVPKRARFGSSLRRSLSRLVSRDRLLEQYIEEHEQLLESLEELTKSERQYRLLTERSRDIIWSYSIRENRFQFVSKAVEDVLGYTPDEVAALNLSDVIPDGELDRVRADFRDRIRAGAFEEAVVLEVEHFHSKGHRVCCEVHAGVVLDDQGDTLEINGVTRDVTARKEAEAARIRAAAAEAAREQLEAEVAQRQRVQEELRDAKEAAEEGERLKSAILANISHEVRTPLTAILGFAEILEIKADSQDTQHAAKRIARAGARLMDFLNNIVELAKTEAEGEGLFDDPHYFRPIVDDVVEVYRLIGEKRRIEIDIEIPSDLKTETDTALEKQLLYNLVGNAVRYTEHGTITVKAASGKQGVLLEIVDTGEGISDAFLPYVFEPWRQEAGGNARNKAGSGLGLAICKRLVEKAGGSIAIESCKGMGTTVSVLLPYRGSETEPISWRPGVPERI